jgi:hypothetical protein
MPGRVEPAQQIAGEQPLVPGHHRDLALAQRRHLPDQPVPRHRDPGSGRVHPQHLLDAPAHHVQRVLGRVRAGEQVGDPDQGVVVVREDRLLLGPEVPEEGAPGDARRRRDLVDRGLLVPLVREQLHRRRRQVLAHLLALRGHPAAGAPGCGACARLLRFFPIHGANATRRTGSAGRRHRPGHVRAWSRKPRPDLRPRHPAATRCSSSGAGVSPGSRNSECSTFSIVSDTSRPTTSSSANGPIG